MKTTHTGKVNVKIIKLMTSEFHFADFKKGQAPGVVHACSPSLTATLE